MHGASYAGGIELVAAAIDKRIDAIVPTIAWHSLLTSLYKAETFKGGWSALLYAGGQTGRLDSHITSAFGSGATTGRLSPEDRAWFASRGPGDALVSQIRVPTMLLQGTADTLFTTTEAIRNYAILRRHHVPVKMMWFCGGHGRCLTGTGPDGVFDKRVIAWLRRYVAGAKVATGPGFEWLADDARWRSTRRWPPPPGKPIAAGGSGTLALKAADTVSGTPIAAGPAANAVNVAIPAARAQVVGEPRLRLTYSGTGIGTHVFAQIVDEKRNLVLGNQVTPLPVTLDGATHTVRRPLDGVAASLSPGGRYHLQVIGGSQVYGPVRGAASIAFSAIRLSLPTVGRPCRAHSRFTIHLRLRSAKVWVAGRRAKVRGTRNHLRVRVNLRHRHRVTVRIRGRDRHGRLVRETRVYRRCS